MRCLSTLAAICFSVAIATAADVGAPIQAREDCVLSIVNGIDFTGLTKTISGDHCSHLVEPFVENLISTIVSRNCACFLYTDDDCNNCAACVDDASFPDLSQISSVRSFRCKRADATTCANSNCLIKK